MECFSNEASYSRLAFIKMMLPKTGLPSEMAKKNSKYGASMNLFKFPQLSIRK